MVNDLLGRIKYRLRLDRLLCSLLFQWYWWFVWEPGRCTGMAVIAGSFWVILKPMIRHAASPEDRYRASKNSWISSISSCCSLFSFIRYFAWLGAYGEYQLNKKWKGFFYAYLCIYIWINIEKYGKCSPLQSWCEIEICIEVAGNMEQSFGLQLFAVSSVPGLPCQSSYTVEQDEGIENGRYVCHQHFLFGSIWTWDDWR